MARPIRQTFANPVTAINARRSGRTTTSKLRRAVKIKRADLRKVQQAMAQVYIVQAIAAAARSLR